MEALFLLLDPFASAMKTFSNREARTCLSVT
jgi:hypothetical protein